MINPHGSADLMPLYVSDQNETERLLEEAKSLPSLLVNSAVAANAVMLGAGYFTPLKGYMNLADTMSVAEDMKMKDGLFWPVPIVNRTNDISSIENAGRIALLDPNVEGNPVIAIQDVESIETIKGDQLHTITEKVFGTTDKDHPGVSTFLSQG